MMRGSRSRFAWDEVFFAVAAELGWVFCGGFWATAWDAGSIIKTIKASKKRRCGGSIQSLKFENLTTIVRDSKYNHVALPPLQHLPRRKEMAICPECETDLDLDEEELDEGEIVSCPECGSDFEVVTTHPLELNPVSEIDEDEEDDDDEEEDEDSDY